MPVPTVSSIRDPRRRYLRYSDFARLRYSTQFLGWLGERETALAGTGQRIVCAPHVGSADLAVAATLAYAGVPAADDTVTLDTTVYTWKDTPAAAGDILRDANAPALYHFQNLVDAISGTRMVGDGTAQNAHLGLTVETSGSDMNVVVTARAVGTDGNSLTWTVGNGVTATDTDGNAATTGTLSGGDDSTAASDTFRITAIPAGGTIEAGGTTYTFRAPGTTLAANDILLPAGFDLPTMLYYLRDAIDGVALGYHADTAAHATVAVVHNPTDATVQVIAKLTATAAIALAEATGAAAFTDGATTLGHGLQGGEGPWRVSVAPGGILPVPLDSEHVYWVVSTPTPNHIALSSLPGGAPVTIMNAGSIILTRGTDPEAVYELLREHPSHVVGGATDVDQL